MRIKFCSMVKAQEAEFLQVHILIFKIFDQLDNVDLRHLKEHSRGLISFETFWHLHATCMTLLWCDNFLSGRLSNCHILYINCHICLYKIPWKICGQLCGQFGCTNINIGHRFYTWKNLVVNKVENFSFSITGFSWFQ